MLCPIHQAALNTPHHPAYIEGTQIYSFAEWDEAAEGVAQYLRDTVPSGSRIALYKRDPFEVCTWIWGAARHKCTIVLLSDRLSEDQLSPLLIHVGAHVSDHQPSSCRPRTLPTIDEHAIAVILFTSGSTKQPKAVAHSIATLRASAQASQKNIPLQPTHRWLLSLSMWHIGGLAISFRCLLAGATMVVSPPELSLGTCIQKYAITHLSLVSVQLDRLLDEKQELPSLRALLLGGGPIPASLVEKAKHLPLHTTYGMTELASQLCTTPPNPQPELWNTAGYPLEGWEVRIDDDGQICARGAPLFLGYVHPDGLHTPFDTNGWFSTGDKGHINPHGQLVVLGRMDQMFISGGENIHPEEIERLLCAAPTISCALVVPIPHPQWGKRTVAFVQ